MIRNHWKLKAYSFDEDEDELMLEQEMASITIGELNRNSEDCYTIELSDKQAIHLYHYLKMAVLMGNTPSISIENEPEEKRS